LLLPVPLHDVLRQENQSQILIYEIDLSVSHMGLLPSQKSKTSNLSPVLPRRFAGGIRAPTFVADNSSSTPPDQ
jgi:hypothetical protein